MPEEKKSRYTPAQKKAAEKCCEAIREQGLAGQIFVTEFVKNGNKTEVQEG